MSIIHFSEDEITKILKKNPKLNPIKEQKDVIVIDSNIPDKTFVMEKNKNPEKVKVFSMEPKTPKKKPSKPAQTTLTRSSSITRKIQDTETRIEYNDNFFGILFPDTTMLTVNDILTLIQSPKKQGVVWGYKGSWHNRIKKALKEEHEKAEQLGKRLPYFNSSVELTLFRQAITKVDKDALTTMFKYIIDAFKYHPKHNPYGILEEDNPDIVCNIRCETTKSEKRNENNYVGFRIKKTTPKNVVFTPEDILKEDT